MKLILSDAMKNGIKGVTKHKIQYSQDYIKGAEKVTQQIIKDHSKYVETYHRIKNYYVL